YARSFGRKERAGHSGDAAESVSGFTDSGGKFGGGDCAAPSGWLRQRVVSRQSRANAGSLRGSGWAARDFCGDLRPGGGSIPPVAQAGGGRREGCRGGGTLSGCGAAAGLEYGGAAVGRR